MGFLVPYIVLGVAYNRNVKGARGWEMIPQHDLWSAVSSDIKGGFAFVLSCGGSSGASGNYSTLEAPKSSGTYGGI